MHTPTIGAAPQPTATGVGKLIRRRREALGMSRAELATRLSLDFGPRDIAALEDGYIVVPCWSLLQRLGQALALSNDALLIGVLASTSGAIDASDKPTA